ncbi:AMP-binding protein [Eggerthella guodeyinii]|uniref:AMP-binding protein n=1 Tax=Eggerthella guodeyinii TaxID=2690837 RepID=A0A6N7RS76_9ACTN|nr:AMP-binding protein [Eggerthella guodeyinii]MRX84064.1 AMP-binding protein [Eggerthella guodeyinii]
MFLHLDQHAGVHTALKDTAGRSLTYEQLRQDIETIKRKLPTRTLAFCMCTNTVGCVVGYLAMVEAGVVPVMLSASISDDFLGNLLETYKPSIVWFPAESKKDFDAEPVLELNGYRLAFTDAPVCPLNDEIELCMSTSGSTGSPKLVRYKQGNLEANARNVAKAFSWTSKERAFADLGLQYTMGLNVVNTHLFVGATVLLCDYNPISNEYWNYLEHERATNITGVPFTFEIFSRLHFFQKELPHLTTIAQGGGKLSDKRFRDLANYAEATGKRFFATFGTTETSARLAYLPPELAREKIGSIGGPIPEGELFLIDERGERIDDPVAEGEMCYSGPNVTMGYATRRSDLLLGDEWQGTYRTGDLARRDEGGCYYITGRLSRFVKLLGHRVSLDECEQILLQENDVVAACVGNDQKIVVFVEGVDDAAPHAESLRKAIGIRPSQCEGRSISVIPRNETGKIQYKLLDAEVCCG